MLTLTQNASLIVREIANRPGQPETAGLRITSEGVAPSADGATEPTFGVQAAEAAEPGDQVIDADGALVYLDSTTAELLDDKVLDAAVDQQGQVEFALGLQQ